MRHQTIRSLVTVAGLCAALSISAHGAACNINMSSGQQTIDGYGFSSGWSGTLSSARNNATYGTLGVSILRIQIDPGNWDAEIANSNAAHAGGAKVLGSSWTGLGSWTTTGSAYSGHLKPQHYGDYANHLRNAVIAHNLDWVSPANEPDLGWMAWTMEELRTWIGQYGGTLGAPLLGPESCWFEDSYGDPMLNDPAAGPNIAIYGGHLYGAAPSLHQNALNKGKHVWMTEKYFSDSETDMGACILLAQEISECMKFQMSAYIYWNGLVDQNGSIYKNGYTIGQFSKWIRPGSTRVSSDYNPNPNVSVTAYKVNNSTVIVAVNANTNSVSQQFVIQNGNAATMTGYRTSGSEGMANIGSFSVSGGSFTASLAAQSVTTFVQTGSGGGTGVTFHQDFNYGGTASQALAAGNYTLAQLAAMGVPNDWASSARLPAGWTATMYANDNFSGTSWTLTADTASFGSLSPNANDLMSSCRITSGAIADGTYRIVSRHSGKAMDASGAGTANGTQMIQWTYGGGNNQRWTVSNRGNDQYSIIGVQSGRAVDVDNSGTANGSKVQLWDYFGGTNQKFTFTATSGGYYRITPTHATGSCLDVAGISTADGALVHLWTYGGGNNQQWSPQAP